GCGGWSWCAHGTPFCGVGQGGIARRLYRPEMPQARRNRRPSGISSWPRCRLPACAADGGFRYKEGRSPRAPYYCRLPCSALHRELMQTVTFSCPHCQNLMAATADLLGQHVQCPTCGNVVVAPVARQSDSSTSELSFEPSQPESHDSIFGDVPE